MRFEKRFFSETWLVQLSNGEVEVFSAATLEKAFRSGLVSGRTPVRACSSTSTWTYLAIAAGFDKGDDAFDSLSPSALKVDESTLAAGRCDDVSSFRGPFGRKFAAIVSVVAIAGLFVSAAFAFEMQPVVDTVAAVANEPKPVVPHVPFEAKSELRDEAYSLARDLRLLEKRRAQDEAIAAYKAAIAKMAADAEAATPKVDSTFVATTNRFDPMNGKL